MTMIKKLIAVCAATMCTLTVTDVLAADFGKPVTWDSHSLMIDGRRVVPVMGEIHYSRVPANEWEQEVRKMKEGGVTIIATYVFWNHIEEEEGIFRWDGQRSLRRFLEVCRQQEMPVVLRMGPFCHGEARNGGLPDWLFAPRPAMLTGNGNIQTASGNAAQAANGNATPIRLRSTDPRFLYYTERFYRQIFTQVQGLQWKDGGPVMAAQFDNEYRGRGEYLMALKQLALQIGFDLPFYTRTGWPELSTPVPFGEMLPLYGDYADGFWDKETQEGCGNYYKAFNFKDSPIPATAMGEATMSASQSNANGQGSATQPNANGKATAGTAAGNSDSGKPYPYFTCELGGGMATAYHRRPFIYAEDTYSMALVKLGSGSNLLGYYMYHGGTNPEGKLNTLNECQTAPGTANNDLPVYTYDFQAPLGEFGQMNRSYMMLRPLHLFLQDYGELLAPMTATFMSPQDLKQGDDTVLRWSVRSLNTGEAFIFVNNYERFCQLSTKRNVQLEACGVKFPKTNIPSGCMAIFPVNIDGIRYATAQLVAKRDGKVYLMQVKGIPTTICMTSGKVLKGVKAKGIDKPIYQNIYLLTQDEAERFALNTDGTSINTDCSSINTDYSSINTNGTSINMNQVISQVPFTKVQEPGPQRQIVKGKAKVAAAPTEADWDNAAIYKIGIEAVDSTLLSIEYQGDCARLYANGQLIADNFQYGRPFLYGLWRLPQGTTEMELRIMPMQSNAPIYLPREADSTVGEGIKRIVRRQP